MERKVWLVGTSQMAIDYFNVLKELKVNFDVIGRGKGNALIFSKKTGVDAFVGGIEKFLENKPAVPAYAIIAAGAEQLANVTIILLKYGVKNILVEKPGALTIEDVNRMLTVIQEQHAKVYVAYNRRFYSSVFATEEIIKQDDGLLSFHFEFTEWAHIIEKLEKPSINKEKAFISNSTHVVDTAFFLGGKPIEISPYFAGELSWHNPAIFTGAGISDKKALFSYCANWLAPGRWGIELLTNKHRIYLKPMEKVQIQEIGSVVINPLEIDDSLDIKFKPGLYHQTKAFLNNDDKRLCSFSEQKENFGYYQKICPY